MAGRVENFQVFVVAHALCSRGQKNAVFISRAWCRHHTSVVDVVVDSTTPQESPLNIARQRHTVTIHTSIEESNGEQHQQHQVEPANPARAGH